MLCQQSESSISMKRCKKIEAAMSFKIAKKLKKKRTPPPLRRQINVLDSASAKKCGVRLRGVQNPLFVHLWLAVVRLVVVLAVLPNENGDEKRNSAIKGHKKAKARKKLNFFVVLLSLWRKENLTGNILRN